MWMAIALACLTAQASGRPAAVEIRADVGLQAPAQALSDAFDVPLYTETEHVTTTYPTRGGPMLSVAGRYRLWKGLTAGAGVSAFARSGDARVAASVPHPFFDNTFRRVEGTAVTRRDEVAAHVAAGWLLPLTRRVRLEVSAGPAFVRVRQAFVTGISVGEAYPYDSATLKRADVRDASVTAPGIYAAADVGWMFTRTVGAGGLAQFTRARANEQVGDRTIAITAGGIQGGGGIRFVF